jgi:monoamine oxidase
VTVLEARDRLGGRLHTVRFRGVPLDLGGAWIHGPEGNPLTEIADAVGIRRLPTYDARSVMHDADGRTLPREEVARIFEMVGRLIAPDSPLAWRGARDVSLAEAVPLLDPAMAADPHQRRVAAWLGAYVAVMPAPTRPRSRRTAGSPATARSRRRTTCSPPATPRSSSISRGLDIRRKQVVTHVRLTGAGVALAIAERVWEGDRAVITLPLGVLKHGSVAFDPPLPAAKQGAIARLGVGLLNKIVLGFERRFWPGEVDFLRYLPVGAAAEDHAALAAPVGGRLHFGGEAATTEAPSYAHGALIGGRRAAEEILAAS